MRLLAIETSSRMCTIAAGCGHQVSQVTHMEREQLSSRISEWTRETLGQADLKPEDVELVVIGRGPGSWTGLRIGISFARAFAWASDAQCAGVASSDAMVHALPRCPARRIFAVTPARANEMWVAEFVGEGDRPRKVRPEVATSVSEFVDALAGLDFHIAVCGEAVEAVRDEMMRRGITLSQAELIDTFPTAIDIARLALDSRDAGQKLLDLSPIYVSPSQAERNIGRVVGSPPT